MTRVDAGSDAKSCAIVTASYLPDIDRCRLLCDTVDANVTGHGHHYILVASHDLAAFRELEGPRRTVVDERDLLPQWLYSFPDPLSRFRKRIWLSPRTMPLRGWHVQQLRRIAVARHVAPEIVHQVAEVVLFLEADRAVGETDRDVLPGEAADRVVFMDDGNVIESGSPDEVLSNPTHPRTRSFLSRFI